jgi:radical SAM superfamily enzyme YgiQ (UPF0313 family)
MLKEILGLLQINFPKLARVSLYGSIKSLQNKTVDELIELKKLKLGVIYLGFETGDEEVYKFIEKWGNPQGNVETCLKVKAAGIKTNVTIILGLGGKAMSKNHAINTAKMLNLSQPDQIAALTLMIAPGTKLYNTYKEGGFAPLNDFEFLEELKTLLENMEDFRCQFFSNHASNYYPIAARFPKDKFGIIKELDHLIKKRDNSKLMPDSLRGL